MKYLTGLLALLFMQTVAASQCRVNGGPWESVASGWMPVTVPIVKNPSTGRIDLNGYRMECRYTPDNRPPSATDRLYTKGGGPTSFYTGNYRVGMRIKGNDYFNPVPGNILLATMKNNGAGHDLDTYMFILAQGSPGTHINIRKDQMFAKMHLFQNGHHTDHGVNVELHAGNDYIEYPSTCTINGNSTIDVNFNQVDRTQIGESVSASPIRTNIRLSYSCPDAGVTMPITITFRGTATSFDSGVLALSNPNLGTGLLRNGVQVRPNNSFQTNISNSSGGDNVTFVLTRRSGSTPTTGAFSGSGTLVMSVP